MATIPTYRIGRHLTAITITGQTVSVTPGSVGLLADGVGASVNLLAVLETMRSTLRAQKEEISPSTSIREHMVNIADGQSLRLDVIEVNNGTDPTPLNTLVMTYGIFKVSWVIGTITGFIKTKTAYYSRGDYEDGQAGKGKQIASLTLDPVDVGSDSFAIATS